MDELWLGMNDLSTQMYFEWSDETPVTYTKWLPGEPTHAVSGQEDCVVMAGEVKSSHLYLIFISNHLMNALNQGMVGDVCSKLNLKSNLR